MKTLSPSKPVDLGHSRHQYLHMYALAASAAGVTMLALVPLGEAEIIYTPANLQISPIGTYTLDVDNDGTTDFTFFDTYYDALGTLGVKRCPARESGCFGAKFSRQTVCCGRSVRTWTWAPGQVRRQRILPGDGIGVVQRIFPV